MGIGLFKKIVQMKEQSNKKKNGNVKQNKNGENLYCV